MNINTTMFVQMFNFFIVYGILRLFLFRPTIVIIEGEKSRNDFLYDIINEQKNGIDLQQEESRHNWHLCQEYFIAHQPPLFLGEKIFSADIIDDTQEQVKYLSDDHIAKIAIDVRSALEEKIKHVH